MLQIWNVIYSEGIISCMLHVQWHIIDSENSNNISLAVFTLMKAMIEPWVHNLHTSKPAVSMNQLWVVPYYIIKKNCVYESAQLRPIPNMHIIAASLEILYIVNIAPYHAC